MPPLLTVACSQASQVGWKALTDRHHWVWEICKTSANRNRIIRVVEASFEGIIPLMQTPLVGASEGAIRRAEKYHAAVSLGRGIHNTLCFPLMTGVIPRTFICGKEAFQIGLSLMNRDPLLLEEPGKKKMTYEGRTEKLLGVTAKLFELIKKGGSLIAMGPPRIISSMEKLVLEPGEKFSSPYHEIGQTYETFALVRSIGKTGSALFEILREGVHFYNDGAYYKETKFKKTDAEGREWFRKDFEEAKYLEERFIEFMERMTDHILNLLEGVPKLAVHIINLSRAPVPPTVKFILHIFSASMGLISVVRSVW